MSIREDKDERYKPKQVHCLEGTRVTVFSSLQGNNYVYFSLVLPSQPLTRTKSDWTYKLFY